MARPRIEPGSFGPISYLGKHPDTGRWLAEGVLKGEGAKPAQWRALCRYRDPDTHKLREVVASESSKAAAESKLRAAQRKIKEQEGLDKARLGETVAQGVEHYLHLLETGEIERAPRTVSQYRYLADKHILCDASLVAHKRYGDVTTLNIRDDMRRISNAGAHSRLRHYKAVLNEVFQRALDARIIHSNPCTSARLPGNERRPAKVYSNGHTRTKNRALTAKETERLDSVLEEAPHHVADLIHLCLAQGLRIGEAVSLRWQDVDLAEKTLTVAGKLVRIKGEGVTWDPFPKSDLSQRTIPLRQRALKALLRRREERPGGLGGRGVYVFVTPRGGLPDIDNYNSLVRGVLDKAGLYDCTVHTLRRTVEMELEQAGLTVTEREAFMGHTDAVARKHYADRSQVPMRVAELLP